MSDFDKMLKVLGIELDKDVKEAILAGDCKLILDWNENGSLQDWGTLGYY